MPPDPTSTTASRTYDAFGMLVASTGTLQGPFGFVGAQGYQEDGDSGLKLLGHRYYDSSTGRFLTRDPMKDGRNWYDYCANNPLRAVDPTGYFWLWDKANKIATAVSDKIKEVQGSFVTWYQEAKKWPAVAAAAVMATISELARHVNAGKHIPPHSNPFNGPIPNPWDPFGKPIFPVYKAPELDPGQKDRNGYKQ